jgi:hypothetical protein
MKLGNSNQQQAKHFLYAADGAIASATNPQLVLGRSLSRCFLIIQNISTAVMFFEIGGARAHCALTSGVVSSVTIDNAGFNYTNPPLVRFLGGGQPFGGNSSYVGLGQPNAPSPQAGSGGGRPAQGLAVMTAASTGLKVSSVTITDGGAGYLCPPMVFLESSDLDPNGVADPSVGSGAGFSLAAGASLRFDASFCPTAAIAVFCATTTSKFTVRWSD